MEGLPSVVWPLALVLPLVLAVAMIPKTSRLLALALAPLAALPALGLAIFGDTGEDSGAELPWLLIGMKLGLDETTRVFLLFTALLWTIAGVYARYYLAGDENRHRFFAFFLLTMTGNLGLIMARDLASFYLFFSLMSFSAYGVIVYDATQRARRAASVYLIMTIIGEAFVLPAVVIAASVTDSIDLAEVYVGVAASPVQDIVIALALIGFGVKAGAIPLHLWLPLAHPAAPTPASAVLSGTMIKAGLLGWVLLTPVGEIELEGWGTLVMSAGLAAAFYGVLVGLTQRNPKTILAYSSISQMGFMTMALGVGLAVPSAWSLALIAILVYATHHALAKGALFLGVGVAETTTGSSWERWLVAAGLLVPALALAGAPLTGGAIAKAELKAAVELAPAPWSVWLGSMLPLAAVGTTALMGRFLLLVWPRAKMEGKSPPVGLWVPWAASLICVSGIAFLVPEDSTAAWLVFYFEDLWPVAVGALLVGATWLAVRKLGTRIGPEIPEGDLLVPVSRLLALIQHGWSTLFFPAIERSTKFLASQGRSYGEELAKLRDTAVALESWMRLWSVAGALALLLAITILVLSAAV